MKEEQTLGGEQTAYGEGMQWHQKKMIREINMEKRREGFSIRGGRDKRMESLQWIQGEQRGNQEERIAM